jgi:hypothetical protein
MGLPYFEVLLDFEFDALNSLLKESLIMIKEKEVEIENKMVKWKTERLSYHDVPEPFDMYETEIIQCNQFSPLLYNSFFIMSYSIFERYFFDICSYCQNEENIQVSAKDIKGEGNVDQCRSDLIKVIGVDLAIVVNEWAELRKYQTIRNAIVHKNGILKDIEKNLKEFIDKNKSITFDETTKTVYLKEISFISKFTELVEEYFSKILTEIVRQKCI